MERIKELNLYQKVILILLAVMLVVFTILYAITYSRVGFEYAGQILVPHEENGGTVYTGVIRGEDAAFTVTQDQTVTLSYGDKVYGPYTAREDPTAIPEERAADGYMTGVEIRLGDEVFFRGGIYGSGDNLMIFDEDGFYSNVTITFGLSDGTEVDSEGNVVDRMEPTPETILKLMDGPELIRKGDWVVWLCGTIVSIVTAFTILFADELFYFHMSFRVRDPESAEPSDWEIAGRYISWAVLTVMALILYIIGLQ